MKRLLYALPVLGFAVLAYFLFKGLYGPPPDALPAVMVDKPAPTVSVAALDASTQGFGPEDFGHGKVVVLNVFSSTCVPCRLEAPTLAKFAKIPGMVMYGLAWKDAPDKARAFLNEVGNPFTRIGQDVGGHAGLQWGVYGWPETYVIDGKGVIRAHFVGAITEGGTADGGSWSLKGDLLPAIEKARAAM